MLKYQSTINLGTYRVMSPGREVVVNVRIAQDKHLLADTEER